MTSPRRLRATLACVAAALPLAACQDRPAHPDSLSTPPGGEAVVEVPTQGPFDPPATAEIPTTVPPAQSTYPTEPFWYAWAVIQAWHEPEALGDYTTPLVHDQMLNAPGGLGPQWYGDEDQQCPPPVSGVSTCSFNTDHGDLLKVKITNSLLGQPHAATGYHLDPTVYPTDPEEYVREFVDAWKENNHLRMNWLSAGSVVTFVSGKTKPANGYLTCTEVFVDAPAWPKYVRVYGPRGDAPLYRFHVSNEMGKDHAISGYTAQPRLAPACT